MGTITKPTATKPSSAWLLAVPVVGVILLVCYFIGRDRNVHGEAGIARLTAAAALPSEGFDEKGAKATVEAYFAAAAVSDFEKMTVLTGGDKSHPIVSSYKFLRSEGCKAETGLSQDIRQRWSVLYEEVKAEQSARYLRETIPDWKSLSTSEDLAQFRNDHPFLVNTAMHGEGGAALFSSEFFSKDGPFRIEGCTFLVDAEFQSKAGTRIWKRQYVTAIRPTSGLRQESGWMIGSARDVGQS